MLRGSNRQVATEMANPVFAAFRRGGLLLIAAAACGHVCAADTPPAALGAITGVITDVAHVPLASATVTAVTADGRQIRATVTNSAGLYAFADLPAGSWSLTFAVPGYPNVALPPLEVSARKATRRDVVMPGSAQQAAGAVPEALQAPEPGPAVDTQTPFAVGDLGWMNGTTRGAGPVFDTKFFTPEVRFDASYLQDFNQPVDHTITGSTEELRSGEFQIDQVRDRRQLPLARRAGAVPVDVRAVCQLHSAQRCQHRGRSVGPVGCIQVHVGGQRRLSLECEPRPER
jgi:hypothetical protein